MTDQPDPVLYHSPNTRSSMALTLLEEIGAPYRLNVLDMTAGEHRQPTYLAVNPMGKVPALKHGDAVVTEQVAIMLYLADLFPEAQLAPRSADPLRGPYLRWMVYYAACFEPAVTDVATQRAPLPAGSSSYGDLTTVMRLVTAQLSPGPWFLGEQLTAADVLWGGALARTKRFKIVSETPEIVDYIGRVTARPAFGRARAKDATLAARA